MTRVDRLLSVSEVADRLGVSYETVRRWIRKGALEALTVGPTKTLRVPESAVAALIESLESKI